jgi:hypothetical protein
MDRHFVGQSVPTAVGGIEAWRVAQARWDNHIPTIPCISPSVYPWLYYSLRAAGLLKFRGASKLQEKAAYYADGRSRKIENLVIHPLSCVFGQYLRVSLRLANFHPVSNRR